MVKILKYVSYYIIYKHLVVIFENDLYNNEEFLECEFEYLNIEPSRKMCIENEDERRDELILNIHCT